MSIDVHRARLIVFCAVAMQISNQKDGAGILICLESKDPVYLEVAYANLKDKIDPGGDLW